MWRMRKWIDLSTERKATMQIEWTEWKLSVGHWWWLHDGWPSIIWPQITYTYAVPSHFWREKKSIPPLTRDISKKSSTCCLVGRALFATSHESCNARLYVRLYESGMPTYAIALRSWKFAQYFTTTNTHTHRGIRAAWAISKSLLRFIKPFKCTRHFIWLVATTLTVAAMLCTYIISSKRLLIHGRIGLECQ